MKCWTFNCYILRHTHALGLSQVTDVIVNNLVALGESHAEIRDRVDVLIRGGADLHVNDDGIVIDSETCDAVLGVLDLLNKGGVELQRESEIGDVRDWVDGIERDRGRPPLGFTYDDSGTVVPGENYDEVRAVLSMVLDDSDEGLSKRKAAERLDIAPLTTEADATGDGQPPAWRPPRLWPFLSAP